MDGFGKFTYPFCYVPHPLVREASRALISRIDKDSKLKSLFSEGKMLGTLICSSPDQDGYLTLYGFSGLVRGQANIGGFVPPIFDYSNPEGYFRKREAEISASVKSTSPTEDYRRMSAELQDWLFRQYTVHNAKGESLNIKDIFALRGLTPPGGTGECAAPKLLEFAFRNGLHPLAMGEFWYGVSPSSEVREQGCFYPSCTGKCGPLLSWMMQGLDVEPNPLDAGFSSGQEPQPVFEDESLIVVDKPSGMLSVPGKVSATSLLEWLRERYGEVHSCHRLDMDTSGLMVFARTLAVKSLLEQEFANRTVKKAYRARLCCQTGRTIKSRDLRKGARGTVALPLALDYYDRPRQIVDYENGKPAITEYEVLEVLPNGEAEVRFIPITGRTHQIRVHCAHKDGLGRPIKGDRLYGNPDGGRLFLHAEHLEFIHPVTGETMSFTSAPQLRNSDNK